MTFLQVVICEFRAFFSNVSVMFVVIVGSILYAFLYPTPYYADIVRKQRIVVVDKDNSALSKDFIFLVNNADNLQVAFVTDSDQVAKELLEKNEVYGQLNIPNGFEKSINKGVPVELLYRADASYFLIYGTIIEGLNNVGTFFSNEIKMKRNALLGKTSAGNDDTLVHFVSIPLFNPSVGYINYALAAILVFILHQTLLAGIMIQSAGQNILRKKILGNLKDSGELDSNIYNLGDSKNVESSSQNIIESNNQDSKDSNNLAKVIESKSQDSINYNNQDSKDSKNIIESANQNIQDSKILDSQKSIESNLQNSLDSNNKAKMIESNSQDSINYNNQDSKDSKNIIESNYQDSNKTQNIPQNLNSKKDSNIESNLQDSKNPKKDSKNVPKELPYFIKAPIFHLISARIFTFSILYVLLFLIYFGVFFKVYGINTTANSFEFWCFALMFIMGTASFGVMLGTFMYSKSLPTQIILLSSMPLVFMMGFIYPIMLLPQVLQTLIQIVPAYHGINGFLRLNQMSDTLNAIMPHFYALFAIFWICFGISYFRYKKLKEKERILLKSS